MRPQRRRCGTLENVRGLDFLELRASMRTAAPMLWNADPLSEAGARGQLQ
jgi:hypothetical protein